MVADVLRVNDEVDFVGDEGGEFVGRKQGDRGDDCVKRRGEKRERGDSGERGDEGEVDVVGDSGHDGDDD